MSGSWPERPHFSSAYETADSASELVSLKPATLVIPVRFAATTPLKRPVSPDKPDQSISPTRTYEPPKKLQKLNPPLNQEATARRQNAAGPSAPILRVSLADSIVPVVVRQTMLSKIHEHFQELYSVISNAYPNLASEHALAQEDETYRRSTKMSYRNAVINVIACIKKRVKPDNIHHKSVGTEDTVRQRGRARTSLDALVLSSSNLGSLLLTTETMSSHKYVLEIPSSEGGLEPSLEGKQAKCDRCHCNFIVKRLEEAEECRFHWGRAYTSRVDGMKLRTYRCCGQPADTSEGCIVGPHVFYEDDLQDLHKRFPFTETSHSPSGSILDVVAIDCEMIYTTGGMRLARVSVVDGEGKTVLDEFVRLDDGVHVIDYNTRFSGINEDNYSQAVFTQSGVLKALSSFISASTIIIGHGLENDLRSLRMIHHKCVDTAALYPHPRGLPLRRSLRELAKEHLGQLIQAGEGLEGHSSLEDSLATLDLVRSFLLHKT